jgi:hypothetical protein
MLVFAAVPALAGEQTKSASELNRVAYAVDGAESDHGKNQAMWRPDTAGPQGPMQVSEKAAIDVGGGNRFDIEQNRALGRAYLALLHQRYRNWADAISAYNWGLGRLDRWIRAGRPADKLVPGVSQYVRRVLHDSGLCTGAETVPNCPQGSSTMLLASPETPKAFRRNLAKAEWLASQLGR